MSDGVHLLIPFAASAAAGCQQALQTLELPQLQRLLARLSPSAVDQGDARSLSPPHERVLAAASGLPAPDGCIPWAAWQVRQAGRSAGSDAWSWITPCHWHVATDHIVMGDPQQLRLDAQASKALLAAMQPFFSQDGIALEFHAPTRWLARGELFRGLPTASLDRVTGRDIDDWVPRVAAAAPLRRLQQEMQMLLYTHPVNDQRASAGLLAVNSFWASGSGVLPETATSLPPPQDLLQVDVLRDAALRQDWPAWAAAWQQVDGQQGQQFNRDLDAAKPVTVTLCGDSSARSWSGSNPGLWRRMQGALRREPLSKILGSL
ncbi:MAG: phosphoglycerate mutase [Ramlibacter sp.]|nr:phosphoglycerate mutase [Ramlibacter sp.]